MPTIISYPKSGRHWTEALVCQAIAYDEGIDCSDFNKMKKAAKKAHTLEWSHWYVNIWEGTGMQLPLTPKQETVFAHIVRDPRDTVISCYHWRQIKEPLKDFVMDRGGQFEAIIEYLNQIYDMTDNFYRYEDFHSDTETTLKALMQSIGIYPTAEAINYAIEASSMADLRKKDIDEHRSCPEIYRKGQAGGWGDAFDADMVDFTAEALGRLNPVYGYTA